MHEENLTFLSGPLRLAGTLHHPAPGCDAGGESAGQTVVRRRAAIIVLQGFGGNRNTNVIVETARLFARLGYFALRFDMRGCGESEGERGRVLCLEQVEDARAALTCLQQQPLIDPDRIAVMGHSFGAAVAIYSAGSDPRFAACISSGGWGDGEKKFRRQHAAPDAWARFSDMLASGRERLARGESMHVPRFDIVPMPEHLRANIAPGSIMAFPFEVVESMFQFRANQVVGRIAPRPLLLMHSAVDSVTPTEQSIDLFAHAGQPTDLYLFSGVDHYMFAEGNTVVFEVLSAWLAMSFPVLPA